MRGALSSTLMGSNPLIETFLSGTVLHRGRKGRQVAQALAIVVALQSDAVQLQSIAVFHCRVAVAVRFRRAVKNSQMPGFLGDLWHRGGAGGWQNDAGAEVWQTNGTAVANLLPESSVSPASTPRKLRLLDVKPPRE